MKNWKLLLKTPAEPPLTERGVTHKELIVAEFYDGDIITVTYNIELKRKEDPKFPPSRPYCTVYWYDMYFSNIRYAYFSAKDGKVKAEKTMDYAYRCNMASISDMKVPPEFLFRYGKDADTEFLLDFMLNELRDKYYNN